jgi:hypothetical protein
MDDELEKLSYNQCVIKKWKSTTWLVAQCIAGLIGIIIFCYVSVVFVYFILPQIIESPVYLALFIIGSVVITPLLYSAVWCRFKRVESV